MNLFLLFLCFSQSGSNFQLSAFPILRTFIFVSLKNIREVKSFYFWDFQTRGVWACKGNVYSEIIFESTGEWFRRRDATPDTHVRTKSYWKGETTWVFQGLVNIEEIVWELPTDIIGLETFHLGQLEFFFATFWLLECSHYPLGLE